jgi:S-DNA-T family DNA segregation ATPase FtsK/SpoIIIE
MPEPPSQMPESSDAVPSAGEKKTSAAKSGDKSKKKTPSKKGTASISKAVSKRKEEMWGIAIVITSIFLLVAIWSYKKEDDAAIENISLFRIFSEEARLAAETIQNPLGLFGAILSSFLINSILGYPTLLIVAMGGLWGWSLFRRQGFEKVSFATVYAIVFAVLTASLFGLTELPVSQVMSGIIGRFLATVLRTVIGAFGAWVVLITSMLATIVLLVDLDIQKTIDRIKFTIAKLGNHTKEKFADWREKRAELKQQREGQIESELEAELAARRSFEEQQAAEKQRLADEKWEKAKAEEEFQRKVEADRLAKEQADRETQQRLDRLEEEKIRLKFEQEEKRRLKEEQERLEQNRLEKELAQKNDADRLAAAQAEAERQAREAAIEAERHERLRLRAEQSERERAELVRQEKEKAERERLEREQAAAQSEKDFAAMPDHEVIDELIKPLFPKKKSDDAVPPVVPIPALPVTIPLPSSLTPNVSNEIREMSAAVSETAVPAPPPPESVIVKVAAPESSPPAEPEFTINKGVKEKEANFDDVATVTSERLPNYERPSVDLLDDAEEEKEIVTKEELEENKQKILEKLRIYGIAIVRIEATVGPTVTLYELEPAPDVKISKIVGLADDIAMAMAARGIRIIAPIPGKNAVGVEIPNQKGTVVKIKSLIETEKFRDSKMILPLVFGKTIDNKVYIDDLAKMPHVLIAGATGSGKSVGINTILTSLIYSCHPDKVKFLLIDPKRVELYPYKKLRHHFLVKYKDLEEQIITDTDKAVYALKSVEKEMDKRYDKLAKAGFRNIKDYNEKHPHDEMCYIVVIIDELADLMITAGKDVEPPIARLAQLARAIGIHLVVATQRPSVDVITGVIKANFPARIAYQVASKIDSRTILDTNGADQLLGYGDMLYLPSGQPKPIRIQNAYVSTEEVERITEFIGDQEGYKFPFTLPAPDAKVLGLKTDDDDEPSASSGGGNRDKMFEDAARMVVRHQQGSVSLLQRRLKLGFSRAARIMDELEQCGIVGPPDGSKPREVFIQDEAALELKLNDLSQSDE